MNVLFPRSTCTCLQQHLTFVAMDTVELLYLLGKVLIPDSTCNTVVTNTVAL